MNKYNKNIGGRETAPYRLYSTRKYVDHNLDQLRNKITYLKADYRALLKEVKCLIEFMEHSPHANAYTLFRDGYFTKDTRANSK